MPTLLYIHGFLSSPKSQKAQTTQHWLEENRPDWVFECPYLSSYPAEALSKLEDVFLRDEKPVYILGSSLGGFWATLLTEKYQCKAVLVNPVVLPQKRFQEYVGVELKNYHTDDAYTLHDDDIDVLVNCDQKNIINPSLYWLMVQKGDQTLDYQLAVDKYKGSRQLVEEGGNHTFQDFEKWLPEIIQFYENDN